MRAAILLLAGCAMATKYQPITVAAPPDAFDRASRALVEAGETIETKDETAGILLTKWEETTRMGTIYRYRWNISIASGSARVDSQCQFKLESGPTGRDWETCDTQKPDRETKARSFADAISR